MTRHRLNCFLSIECHSILIASVHSEGRPHTETESVKLGDEVHGLQNLLGASKARLIGGFITVCVTGWLTVSLTTVSSLHKSKAEDLAEIQHIKYGLLDATNWVSVATEMADTVLERLSKRSRGPSQT